jgi:hypothetical protein
MRSTKRIGLAVVLVLLGSITGLALAQQLAQEIQQKVAAAKAVAARNQQALKSYSWITKTDLSLKGEVKNSKIESCQYGPDGQVQKTELSNPPPPPEQKRGLRGKIIAKKTAEMKEELEASAALARRYVPPVPEKLQAVSAAGKVSLAQAGPGAIALTFPDYEMQGDSLVLTFESAVKALRQIHVNTWLDDPNNVVTLDVNFQSLPDGTNYAASTVLKIPAKEIEVHIDNSNYQKLGR